MEGGKRQQNKFSKVVTRFHSFMGKKRDHGGFVCGGYICCSLGTRRFLFFLRFFFSFLFGVLLCLVRVVEIGFVNIINFQTNEIT